MKIKILFIKKVSQYRYTKMYVLLLLMVMSLILLTSGFLDIMKALMMFALGYYAGKHFSALIGDNLKNE